LRAGQDAKGKKNVKREGGGKKGKGKEDDSKGKDKDGKDKDKGKDADNDVSKILEQKQAGLAVNKQSAL